MVSKNKKNDIEQKDNRLFTYDNKVSESVINEIANKKIKIDDVIKAITKCHMHITSLKYAGRIDNDTMKFGHDLLEKELEHYIVTIYYLNKP